jgi:hypothetical protein
MNTAHDDSLGVYNDIATPFLMFAPNSGSGNGNNGNGNGNGNVKQPDNNVKQPDNNVKQPDNNVKQPDNNVKQPDNNVKQPDNNGNNTVQQGGPTTITITGPPPGIPTGTPPGPVQSQNSTTVIAANNGSAQPQLKSGKNNIACMNELTKLAHEAKPAVLGFNVHQDRGPVNPLEHEYVKNNWERISKLPGCQGLSYDTTLDMHYSLRHISKWAVTLDSSKKCEDVMVATAIKSIKLDGTNFLSSEYGEDYNVQNNWHRYYEGFIPGCQGLRYSKKYQEVYNKTWALAWGAESRGWFTCIHCTRDGKLYFADGHLLGEWETNNAFTVVEISDPVADDQVNITAITSSYDGNVVYFVVNRKYIFRREKDGEFEQIEDGKFTEVTTICCNDDGSWVVIAADSRSKAIPERNFKNTIYIYQRSEKKWQYFRHHVKRYVSPQAMADVTDDQDEEFVFYCVIMKISILDGGFGSEWRGGKGYLFADIIVSGSSSAIYMLSAGQLGIALPGTMFMGPAFSPVFNTDESLPYATFACSKNHWTFVVCTPTSIHIIWSQHDNRDLEFLYMLLIDIGLTMLTFGATAVLGAAAKIAMNTVKIAFSTTARIAGNVKTVASIAPNVSRWSRAMSTVVKNGRSSTQYGKLAESGGGSTHTFTSANTIEVANAVKSVNNGSARSVGSSIHTSFGSGRSLSSSVREQSVKAGESYRKSSGFLKMANDI